MGKLKPRRRRSRRGVWATFAESDGRNTVMFGVIVVALLALFAVMAVSALEGRQPTGPLDPAASSTAGPAVGRTPTLPPATEGGEPARDQPPPADLKFEVAAQVTMKELQRMLSQQLATVDDSARFVAVRVVAWYQPSGTSVKDREWSARTRASSVTDRLNQILRNEEGLQARLGGVEARSEIARVEPGSGGRPLVTIILVRT